MLSEFYTAFFLVACLAIFFALNLFNLLEAQRRKHGVSIKSNLPNSGFHWTFPINGFIFSTASFSV
jgi:hypothetical protein